MKTKTRYQCAGCEQKTWDRPLRRVGTFTNGYVEVCSADCAKTVAAPGDMYERRGQGWYDTWKVVGNWHRTHGRLTYTALDHPYHVDNEGLELAPE